MIRLVSTIAVLGLATLASAETRISVQGSRKGETAILALAGDRFEHIRNSPAAPSTADDAAFILTRLLRQDGYASAKVDWKIEGSGKVVLLVNEGPRNSLGSVRIEGIDDTDDTKRLSKIYAGPAEKNRPLGTGSAPFRESDIQPGLASVRQDLQSRGYWDVTAEVIESNTDPATGHVDVRIMVKPGVQYRIGSAQIDQETKGVRDTIQEISRGYVGRIANTKNLNALRGGVQEAIVAKGFPNATLSMANELASGWFTPVFAVQVGERVKLRNLNLSGLEKTDPDRVRNILNHEEDEWYDKTRMNDRVRSLLSTGAFSSARIDTEPVSTGTIDATLHLVEGKAREVSFSAGYGTYYGPIGRVTYADRNLFGWLVGFSAGLEVSSRGLLGDVRVLDPWWLDTDTSASARLYALSFSREGYTKLESGLEGGLERKFGDHYNLSLLAGTSGVKVSGDGLPSRELGEKTYAHPRLSITQTYDTRDSAVLPKSGWHASNTFELGSAVANTTTAYGSVALDGGWFHVISKASELAIGGEMKLLAPSGDTDDLPIDLRVFNGGPRSVRSFPQDEMGREVNGYPTGGEAMWNLNTEYIRKLSGVVKGVAFIDAGSIAQDYGDIVSSELEVAAGLGIRLELPVGPIRLEYGYNLTKDTGEPTGTFHFAIGNAF